MGDVVQESARLAELVCNLLAGTIFCNGGGAGVALAADACAGAMQIELTAVVAPADAEASLPEAADWLRARAGAHPRICSLDAVPVDDGTLLVTLSLGAGADDPLATLRLLVDPPSLGFYAVRETIAGASAEQAVDAPSPNALVQPDLTGETVYVLDAEPLAPARAVVGAEVVAQDWGPEVHIRLSDAGAAAFAVATKRLVGESIAMSVAGVVISAPRVIEPIRGGTAVISGYFTRAEAEELAWIIAAPPPPVALEIVSADARARAVTGAADSP